MVIAIDYPEVQCPFCLQQPGTEPGLCHLLPSEADPIGVLIAFSACEGCERRVRGATGEAHENIRLATVQFFDNWLELEYGRARGTA